MTAQPPSGSDHRDPLGFDELAALLIAFAAVGAILWWVAGRRVENWLSQTIAPANQAVPSASPFNLRSASVTPSVLPSIGSSTVSPSVGTVEVQPSVVVQPPIQPNRGAIPGAAVLAPAIIAPAVLAPNVAPTPTPTVAPISPTAAVAPSPQIVVPSVAASATPQFSDVPETYWAYPFINELSKRNMTTGFQDGTFRPDQPVTRAEYATLISKVLPNAQRQPIPFSDVPAGFWGAPAIDEAVKAGFLKGYPNETFQPRQQITKLQVLLSLVNGFKLAEPANPNASLQPFNDRDQIPAWARSAMAAATQSGVVVNYPNVGQLGPDRQVTRGEVAAMLYQALTTTGQVQPIQSNYIVRP